MPSVFGYLRPKVPVVKVVVDQPKKAKRRRRKPLYARVCAWCSGAFKAKSRKAKTCREECLVAWKLDLMRRGKEAARLARAAAADTGYYAQRRKRLAELRRQRRDYVAAHGGPS